MQHFRQYKSRIFDEIAHKTDKFSRKNSSTKWKKFPNEQRAKEKKTAKNSNKFRHILVDFIVDSVVNLEVISVVDFVVDFEVT